MAGELVSGPVIEVAKVGFGWAAKRWRYAKDLPDNSEALGACIEILTHMRMDVELEVERAKREGNLPKNEVVGWMEKAGEAISTGKECLHQYASGGGKNFSRMVNPSKYKLGKQMLAMIATIKELTERGKFPRGEFAVPDIPQLVQRVPGGNMIGISDTPASYSSEGQKSSSQLKILDKILKWIQQSEIHIIGVYGQGGVGKTTIIKKIINDQLYGKTRFDVVIFVVVSSSLDMRQLRKRIAEKVLLVISGEEDDTAAQRLYNVLLKKKFFLIFDDVWQGIDLEVLGVPPPTTTNGCKIALTTRTKAVCREMQTDQEINVSCLLKNEAWELFCENAGGAISSSIESTAKLVCEECDGLPLALIVVGRALRKVNNAGVWEHKLNVLRSSQLEDKVFSTVRLSYDSLKSDKHRECFLYCALFPEDYSIFIDDLVVYWVTEGIVDVNKGFANALDIARHQILNELLDSCLLKLRKYAWIRMHDVIRDMAIRIISENGIKFSIHIPKRLNQTLTDIQNSHKLPTLLCMTNLNLKYMDSFFSSIVTLRILDLSDTNIKSLPKSISGLVNLQALLLPECHHLTDITDIGSLKNLLLLDLSYTGIIELPYAIRELNRLRGLHLSYTYNLKRISPGSISQLTDLEFLEMAGSAYFKDDTSKQDIIHDIGCLRHLHHLTLDISSNDDGDALCLIFPKFAKLVSFDIGIRTSSSGSEEGGRGGYYRRSLRLGQFTNFGLVRCAHQLVLQSMNMFDRVSSLGVGNLENLNELRVICSQSISKAIIDDEKLIMMPKLEVLNLYIVPKLPCVWEVKGATGTFRSIKLVELYRCHSAKFVFSMDVISELGCLENLTIHNCDNMEQLVREGEDNQNKKFPKLQYIRLRTLSSLKDLWVQQVFLPSLKEISIMDCKSLKHLPLSQNIAPTLGCIAGEQEWWDHLTFTPMTDNARAYFQPLFNPRNLLPQKIVVKLRMGDEKRRSRALQTVAGVPGVISATLYGKDMDRIVIVGEGMDAITITQLLRKLMGSAELLSVYPVEVAKERTETDRERGDKDLFQC